MNTVYKELIVGHGTPSKKQLRNISIGFKLTTLDNKNNIKDSNQRQALSSLLGRDTKHMAVSNVCCERPL